MRKIIKTAGLFVFAVVSAFAQQADDNWINKAIPMDDRFSGGAAYYGKEETYENSKSTLKLVKPLKPAQAAAPVAAPAVAPAAQAAPVGTSAVPDVISAARAVAPVTQPVPKPADEPAPEPEIGVIAQPSIAQPQHKKETPPAKPKSNINWKKSGTANFDIFIEPGQGVATPNLAMKFETVHQVLRKNISWMMGGKTAVYIYRDRESFLKNEPFAKDWTGAFFSPGDNRIVMYDNVGKTESMVRQFSHELTHLFVENFYNPPGEPFKLEPPIWVNEGLAVNMEDIAQDPRGGVWAQDLVVLNILSEKEDAQRRGGQKGIGRAPAKPAQAKGGSPFTDKTVVFTKFGDFIKSNSYDVAVAKGDVENWYFQAYAMVRFLFKPFNAAYPEKRMQFEQFSKLMNTYGEKKDKNGKPALNTDGKKVMVRMPCEEALARAYRFRNVDDFEQRFWQWLRDWQKQERERLLKEQQK